MDTTIYVIPAPKTADSNPGIYVTSAQDRMKLDHISVNSSVRILLGVV